MKPILPLLILLSVALLRTPAVAVDQPLLEEPSTDRDDLPEAVPWQEGRVMIPPYPRDEDLVEFSIDDPDSPFRYFMDTKHLDVGEDDVVRYTLVIRSRSGAANVSFEGIRCDQKEYKIYAFGDGRGRLRPIVEPQWERIGSAIPYPHISELREFYLCKPHRHLPFSVDDIVHRLRSGPQRTPDQGFL
jgi:hypothetical protein